MRSVFYPGLFVALLGLGFACGDDTTIVKEVELVTLACSPSVPAGACDAGSTCFDGACAVSASLCSPANAQGRCTDGMTCWAGGCVLETALCSATNPEGPCETGKACLEGTCIATASLCSSSNPSGECAAGKVCRDGMCAGTGVVVACEEQVVSEQPTIAARTAVVADAKASATLAGVAAGDTFTVGNVGSSRSPMPPEAGVRFTAVAGDPGAAEFRVGANDAQTAANLALAINTDIFTSRLVEATADGSRISFTAVEKGAAGNAIGLAGTSGSFDIPVGATAGGVGTGKAVLALDGMQFKDASGNGELEPYEDWRLRPICRAMDLVERMSVPEKVGLMSEGGTLGNGTADGLLTTGARANIANLHVRQALLRLGSRSGAEIALYANNLQELAEAMPHGIPIVLTADPVHSLRLSTNAASGAQALNTGVVSMWPTPLGLGAANDRELSWLYGDTVRREFMAAGMRWQLGPMVDVATEPRWERVQNTFGENAVLVARHSRACVEGFQGSSNGDLRQGIAATVKHFPGAGTNENGMDSHSYDGRLAVHPGGNFEYHLLPFQAVFDAGAASLMACYSIFEDQLEHDPLQVPAGFSHGMITALGKERMGFAGMVTGDWGTAGGSAYGALQNMSNAERAAMWLQAGSHQYGSDSSSNFQDAFDQGLVTEGDIDGAAIKILEMSFKLGLFENPYVDPAAASTIVKGREASLDGFDAQKRAIVLLRNQGSALPISGGNNGSDANADGVVRVHFDGVVDALHGSDPLSNFIDDYDYRTVAGEGVLAVEHEADIGRADVAVLRIAARKGTYFGLDAGVPLSFDAPFPGSAADRNLDAAIRDRNRVIDAFRVRDGYVDASGEVVPAANPNLKIVLVMMMDRPSIVKPFIHGLRSLDEIPGEPGSYPTVSNEANINQTIVTATSPGQHAGVDAFLVDFGAFDRAVLDFIFDRNVPQGVNGHGRARLPMEIPSSDAEVDAQYEDLPADTRSPTFRLGAGMDL